MRNALNLPNILTLSRIFLSFIVAWNIVNLHFIAAIIAMLIAGLTDFFDGYLARKLNLATTFGAALDPFADKLLMLLAYLSASHVDVIPLYIVVLVISRDVLIIAAVVLCAITKVDLKISPIRSSKINTTVQVSYILFVLACNYFHLHITSVEEIFAGVVAATTIWSGAEYVQKYRWIGRIIFR